MSTNPLNARLMSINDLTGSDRVNVEDAVRAVLEGPWLDDTEFATRIGVERSEANSVVGKGNLDDALDSSVGTLLINNALNEVANGLRIDEHEWSRWFSIDRAEFKRVLERYRASRGWSD